MAEVIRMPRMSDTMEEAKLVKWFKSIGDEVETGDTIAEVETDKAIMELDTYVEGYLLHIAVQEGDTVKLNEVIAVIGDLGEDIQTILNEANLKITRSNLLNKGMPTIGNIERGQGENLDVIRMPNMSDNMENGVISLWLKNVGDYVQAAEVLAEIETDKATIELESYRGGTLLYQGGQKGDSIPVNTILAIIGNEGADYQSILNKEL